MIHNSFINRYFYFIIILFLILINLTINVKLPNETINLFSNFYFKLFFIIVIYIVIRYNFLVGLLILINFMVIIYYSLFNKNKMKIKY